MPFQQKLQVIMKTGEFNTVLHLLFRVLQCGAVKQGKSEGFDSCDRPSNLTQIGFKSSISQPL